MQRQRGSGGAFSANGAAFKRQRQSRPNSRFESEEGRETYTRVDLGKLKVASLRRYVRTFDLQGVNPLSSKEDLLAAVSKHFAQDVVDEAKVVESLIIALKKGQTNNAR